MQAIPADLREALTKLQQTVASIGPDGAVQGDLLRTLDELRGLARSIKSLSTTIDEEPNSVIWGKNSSGNPTPRAPRGNR
jgi:paraquat-inducible protein B